MLYYDAVMSLQQLTNPQFKIYRNGKYSITDTLTPVIKDEVNVLYTKVNYFFANSHWPNN